MVWGVGHKGQQGRARHEERGLDLGGGAYCSEHVAGEHFADFIVPMCHFKPGFAVGGVVFIRLHRCTALQGAERSRVVTHRDGKVSPEHESRNRGRGVREGGWLGTKESKCAWGKKKIEAGESSERVGTVGCGVWMGRVEVWKWGVGLLWEEFGLINDVVKRFWLW